MINQDKLISVLMPIYKPNIEWLDIAIKSILNQTYKNFELLLLYEPIEGDNVYSYLETINDNRIKTIVTPSMSGLPKSLNIGLDCAKGEFIARMDADDYSMPDRFEKQIEYMNSHNEVVVLGTPAYIMGTKSQIFRYKHLNIDQRLVKLAFENCGIAHPTAMFRKDYFIKEGIRYNEKVGGSEDYYLWTSILINGGLIDSLRQPLLDYRVSDIQASKTLSLKMKEWDVYLQTSIIKYMFNTAVDSELWEKISCVDLPVKDDFYNVFRICRDLRIKSQSFKSNRKISFICELSYRWTRKAVHEVRNNRNFKMFYPKYYFKIVSIPALAIQATQYAYNALVSILTR